MIELQVITTNNQMKNDSVGANHLRWELFETRL